MFARSWRIAAAAAFAAGCVGGEAERAGRMRHWQLPGSTAMTIVMATVWAKEKGLDKGKGEGEFKDGFVFSCCLILLLFFGFSFSIQVDWFLIKIKSIVGWASLARLLVQLFKFGGPGVIHQVQVDCLSVISCKISLPVIQIWSLHFCLATIVWESIVATSCIRHWHKTGLQTL